MSGQENKNRVDDMSTNQSDSWMDDLLARDREAVRNATADRIAAGLHSRLTLVVRDGMRRRAFGWRWILVSAGLALMILAALWSGVPKKTASPKPNVAVQPASMPVTNRPAETPRANTSARRAKRTPLKLLRSGFAARLRAPQVVPKRSVFPGLVVPTDQERLLMEVAQNHPDQLPVIAKEMADDSAQLQEQRKAFEKWLKDGGTI